MVALADRIAELRALGYNAVLAEAKVVHDVIIRMLDVIFTSRPFLRRLNNAKANWMSIEPTIAIRSIQDVVGRL